MESLGIIVAALCCWGYHLGESIFSEACQLPLLTVSCAMCSSSFAMLLGRMSGCAGRTSLLGFCWGAWLVYHACADFDFCCGVVAQLGALSKAEQSRAVM